MLEIQPERLLNDLNTLSQYGSTGDGGVHRPAFSPGHMAARAWLRETMEAEGLAVQVDAAGNHSGVLRCGPAEGPHLLLGSHLDSVPHGGRFDGAVGVLSGLEVLRAVKEAGLKLPWHLEVIDFTDEEGTFIGLLGSRSLAGSLSESDLAQPRGGAAALQAAFQTAGIQNPLAARRPPDRLAGYLEVHIEQAGRLLEQGAEIGVVSGLVGITSLDLRFIGRADHAGTTPITERLDAGLGAAEFMLQATDLVREGFPGAVINFGATKFQPGAYNIVPEMAHLAVEFRAPGQEELDRLERSLLQLARTIVEKRGLQMEHDRLGCVPPSPCHPDVRAAFRTACDQLGLRHVDLPSGAGHDVQAMAAVCPSGMIFIPSTGGSHNPGEYASPEAIANGASVLLRAVLALA